MDLMTTSGVEVCSIVGMIERQKRGVGGLERDGLAWNFRVEGRRCARDIFRNNVDAQNILKTKVRDHFRIESGVTANVQGSALISDVALSNQLPHQPLKQYDARAMVNFCREIMLIRI